MGKKSKTFLTFPNAKSAKPKTKSKRHKRFTVLLKTTDQNHSKNTRIREKKPISLSPRCLITSLKQRSTSGERLQRKTSSISRASSAPNLSSLPLEVSTSSLVHGFPPPPLRHVLSSSWSMATAMTSAGLSNPLPSFSLRWVSLASLSTSKVMADLTASAPTFLPLISSSMTSSLSSIRLSRILNFRDYLGFSTENQWAARFVF